jgi:hypothetical protein
MNENEVIIECSICFYPVISDKYVTECEHTFHQSCLRKWNLQRLSCPLCNGKITEIGTLVNDLDYQSYIASISIDVSRSEIGTLVNDLEYQRYVETINRHDIVAVNNNNNYERNRRGDLVIINDYDETEIDYDTDETEIDFDETDVPTIVENISFDPPFDVNSKKNKTLIVLEIITTCGVISCSESVLHISFASLCGISSICWRLRFIPNRGFPYFFKSAYLFFYLYLQQDYYILYAFIPWFVLLCF